MKIYILCVVGYLAILADPTRSMGQSGLKRPVFDSAQAIKEISIQTQKYINAFSRSDSVTIGNLYSMDAEILNSGSPSTIGRASVTSFYGEMIRAGITGFGYITTGVWGSDNDLVVEEGTAVFSLSNGTAVSKGRYLLVWKRENGVLKMFRDTFASDGKTKN